MVDFTALPGSLDLFEILVNYVFGGILVSLIGWALVILITGIFGRLGMPTILIILSTYFLAVSVGYIGALAAVPAFIGAFWYMTVSILNKMTEIR